MIEISTPVTNSSDSSQVESESSPEDLEEEDQLFFSNIQNDLNKIAKKPRPGTIKAILSYSKSL